MHNKWDDTYNKLMNIIRCKEFSKFILELRHALDCGYPIDFAPTSNKTSTERHPLLYEMVAEQYVMSILENTFIDAVKTLLNNGAEVNHVNGSKSNMLYQICSQGFWWDLPEIVPSDTLKSIKHNVLELINLFISYGIDINAENLNNRSSFSLLAYSYILRGTDLAYNCARLLLKAGANPDIAPFWKTSNLDPESKERQAQIFALIEAMQEICEQKSDSSYEYEI